MYRVEVTAYRKVVDRIDLSIDFMKMFSGYKCILSSGSMKSGRDIIRCDRATIMCDEDKIDELICIKNRIESILYEDAIAAGLLPTDYYAKITVS